MLGTQCPGHRRSRAFERGEAAKGRPFTDLSGPEPVEHLCALRGHGSISDHETGITGSYTFILAASNEIPKLFKNNKRTVGIRVPDHPIPQAIVRELGHPLVVASVHDPDLILDHTTDPERIEEHLGHQVEIVIDGGLCGLEGSTVIDLTQGEPIVLREGKGTLEGLF